VPLPPPCGGGDAPPEPGGGGDVPPVIDDDGIILGPPTPAGPSRTLGARRAPQPREPVPGLDGTTVSYTEYITPQGKPYPNFLLNCTKCPKKKQCYKTKGMLDKNMKNHGEIEPLSYLHVWDTIEAAPGKTHRASSPPREAVARFAEERGDEVKVVLDSLLGRNR